MDSQLISGDQICEALKISKQTLRRWCKQGLFPQPTRLTRRTLRWHPEVVDAWSQGFLDAAAERREQLKKEKVEA